jgi:4-amino-4-deoxy-L-arabinose transferase-like glycosyltransferase
MSAVQATLFGDPRRRFAAALALIVLVYLALSLPLVGHQGTNWDEQTDLEIAEVYTQSWRGLITGSRIEGHQVRLPAYSVALLAWAGLDLGTVSARLVSCAVGALSILLVAMFARHAVGDAKALLAAAIVATSPYFIAYSHLAFTEGDAFVTCATGAVLWTAERFRRSPTWPRSCGLGLALGLAVSTKISAAMLVVAVALVVLLPSAWSVLPAHGRNRAKEALPWILASSALGAWLLLQMVTTGSALWPWRQFIPSVLWGPIARLALIASLGTGLLIWAFRRRASDMPAVARLVHPLLLAVATFFTAPIVHTTNPAVLAGILYESRQTTGGFDPGFALEAAALHFAVILLKPSLLIGGLLWLATLRAAVLARRRPELRLPVAMYAIYSAFLLTLSWAQTRYMLPMLPIMAVLLADAIVDLARRHRHTMAAVALAAIGLLAWDYRLCYPDLNLNGYQWVGARYWAGRSTLGYRAIAQVGSDGAEQVLRWTALHAPPGSRVASYLPPHLTRSVLGGQPVEVINGFKDRDALLHADYVLSSLNAELRRHPPPDAVADDVLAFPWYDRGTLEVRFHKVFSVRRAFDLEVASVWRRRDARAVEDTGGDSEARGTPATAGSRE